MVVETSSIEQPILSILFIHFIFQCSYNGMPSKLLELCKLQLTELFLGCQTVLFCVILYFFLQKMRINIIMTI